MTEKRKRAIARRRLFIALVAVVLAATVGVVALLVKIIDFASVENKPPVSSDVPVSSTDEDITSSEATIGQDDKPQYVTYGDVTLDASFSRLLLVNGDNPLPDDYDSGVRDALVEVDPKYRNNNYVTQIHKDVYPYITAMVAAAQADGVDLRVWSPFRSYAIQNELFRKQVDRVGGDEAKAATVVARPGTSEHNTGLCADFNMASDSFESTPMYTWMVENAEDYGFILRYPKDKIDITGVIYESWHWRFVGINAAKEMNELGLTLEEFVEQKGIDTTEELRLEVLSEPALNGGISVPFSNSVLIGVSLSSPSLSKNHTKFRTFKVVEFCRQ